MNYAQTVLQIVYFYNPFLWLANAVIRRVREEAVDETVLVAMGSEAESYPQTLLRVARFSLYRPNLALGMIGISEGRSTLGQRIRRMLSHPIPTNARLGLAGGAVLIAFAAVLLPMASGQKVEPKPAADATPSALSVVYGGKTAQQWFDQYDFNTTSLTAMRSSP